MRRYGTRRFPGWLMAGALVLAAAGPAMAEPDAEGRDRPAPGVTEPVSEAVAPQPAAKGDWFSPEVLVTATRGEAEAFGAPYMTQIVPLSGFEHQRLYRTPTQALQEVPGVMVQKTSHAQGSPYIRGFTGFRTLLLVDGIRMNNSVFRDGPNQYWNLIDPYTIDRLEVVKGPASVLYGSDAIGGTVNAILRRPDMTAEGWDWYRRIYGRVSTAERSYVGRGEANISNGPWLGILVGGTWKDFGDIDGGGGVGIQDRTGYGVCSGDVRFEYHPDADSLLTFAHYQLYEDDAWRTHSTIDGIDWEGAGHGSDLRRVIDEHRTLTYLRYARRNMGEFIDAVELTASIQTLGEEQWRTRSDGRKDRTGFDVETYGLSAQFETPSPIGRWTYGVEWYRDEVRSYSVRYLANGAWQRNDVQGPVGDDARYDLVGLYVQNQIPLGDRLELLLGGRYTYARAEADEVLDPNTNMQTALKEDWDALVGSARLSWFVDSQEHWNVFGGVSQGFRAPNLSDLTRFDIARSNEIETPAPGLDPERYITYEAGIKAQYDNFAAQAGYYYTDIDDMIVRVPTGNVIGGNNEVTKRNAGDGYVHGVELSARYRFHPQWTVFGSSAWMYGEVETYPTSAPIKRSEPLDRLMPTTTQVGLRWEHPEKKVWVETICTAACEANRLSTRDKSDTQRIPPGGTPGYFTVDLRAGWEIRDGLELFAGVQNLTNEGYRIHGSGVNEPGINFKAGLKWRF